MVGRSNPIEPFDPALRPSDDTPIEGVDPIFPTIFRAAVTGADAYRLTRSAVRREGPVLRLGNRFVPGDRFREIGFVAVGNAAVSQALAVNAVLGERLSQGFVAGPDRLPSEVPFRSVVVDPVRDAGRTDAPVAGAVLELAAGLGNRDLLLVLLSPGSLPLLSDPPPGFDRPQWIVWLNGLRAHGISSADAALIARVLGRGAGGGRLAAASRAMVVALVVDRGDGADRVGGGPTQAVTDADRTAVRSALTRSGAIAELPAATRTALDAGAAPLSRAATDESVPVVVAQPGDALRELGSASTDRAWRPVLAELALDADPAAAAERLVARTRELRTTTPMLRADGRGPAKGLLSCAGTTLGVPDGFDDRVEVDRFLRGVAQALPWRGASVALLRTQGAASGAVAPGLVAAAVASGGTAGGLALRPVPMRSGITDVGLLAIVAVPAIGP